MKERNKKSKLILWSILILIVLIFTFYLNKRTEEGKGIVSLTFDDGIQTHYKSVFPLMNEYEYKGTIYLLANWSGLFEGRKLMSFEQAKEMQDKGWEIGSHTLNHKNLITLSEEEINKQLLLSKEILEKEGFVIKTIAYPFGYTNKTVQKFVRKYYFAGRTTEQGYNNLNNFDAYRLKSKLVKLETTP